MYYFYKLNDNQTIYSSVTDYIAISPHWHEHSELFYVEEGSVLYYIEDDEKPVVLNAGEMLYIKPNILHTPAPEKDVTYKVHIFSFLEYDISNPLNRADCSECKDYFKQAMLPEQFRKNTEEMMNFVHSLSLSEKDEIVYLKQFTVFLLGLLDRYRVQGSEGLNDKRIDINEQCRRIHDVCKYIEENLETNISIEELAKTANYSPSHFYRIFKEIMGCTVVEYTARIKVREAHRILESGKENITEVSNRLGFSHPNNFSRTYRRLTGRNPSEDMTK